MLVANHIHTDSNNGEFSVARRLARGLFSAVFLNPHAIVASLVFGCLLGHLILGMHRGHTDCVGWELHEVLRCWACVVVLAAFISLAVGHVVVMFIAGWRNGRA